jgi:hypothetical protein
MSMPVPVLIKYRMNAYEKIAYIRTSKRIVAMLFKALVLALQSAEVDREVQVMQVVPVVLTQLVVKKSVESPTSRKMTVASLWNHLNQREGFNFAAGRVKFPNYDDLVVDILEEMCNTPVPKGPCDNTQFALTPAMISHLFLAFFVDFQIEPFAASHQDLLQALIKKMRGANGANVLKETFTQLSAYNHNHTPLPPRRGIASLASMVSLSPEAQPPQPPQPPPALSMAQALQAAQARERALKRIKEQSDEKARLLALQEHDRKLSNALIAEQTAKEIRRDQAVDRVLLKKSEKPSSHVPHVFHAPSTPHERVKMRMQQLAREAAEREMKERLEDMKIKKILDEEQAREIARDKMVDTKIAKITSKLGSRAASK